MTILEDIEKIAYQLKAELKKHIEISDILEIEKELSNIYYEAEKICSTIENRLRQNDIKDNYLIQLNGNYKKLLSSFPFQNQSNFNNFKHPQNKISLKARLEQSFNQFKIQFEQLRFNFEFFNKLNFFSDNIVAIGANGSGKSSLANQLKNYFQDNCIMVSAQRVLNIPQFDIIKNPSNTSKELEKYQKYSKIYKTSDSYNFLYNEFNIVLQNLLSDNIAINNKYTMQATALGKQKEAIPVPEISKLRKTFSIWNDLIEHRIIETLDGIDIVVRPKMGDDYQAIQMSDAEKVILYLIAQILQAPREGFIIVDEPEMHLHKTILKKLWDRLEIERDDCIFIYLTHDLDFATSRNSLRKFWIKSYNLPQDWIIESIPFNDLPENLMLEVLGSRKIILFCEGEKGKIDENIYRQLFPDYTIMPVGSCTCVINYTRAYNKLPNTYSKALGIIDADFHEAEEIEKLKQDNIFTYNVSEPENLFLNINFLELLAKQLMKEESVDIEHIKTDIITQFKKDKELQISNYLSAKINYHFSVSHVKKGNNKSEIIDHLCKFNSIIEIEKWYVERESAIDKIISDNDYDRVILFYNNKGLKQIINKHFEISDFPKSALSLLSRDDEAKKILLKYYPDELKKSA